MKHFCIESHVFGYCQLGLARASKVWGATWQVGGLLRCAVDGRL